MVYTETMGSYHETGMLHALVIDDDADMRALMVDTLLPEGVQVIPVASAEAGLEQLPYHRFDAAFIDHMLPGMEGLVFGEFLQRNNPEMAISLVTGSAEEGLERRCREHGIRLVPKPFDPDVIIRVITEAKASLDHAHRAADETSNYHPDLGAYLSEVESHYDLPAPPNRLEEALVRRLRAALTDMKHHNDHSEATRAFALAGLLACRVLGLRLPRSREGTTWYEVYDEVMVTSQRRREFEQLEEEP